MDNEQSISQELDSSIIFRAACARLHPKAHKGITLYRSIDERTRDHVFGVKREIEGRNDYLFEELHIEPQCPARRAVDLIIDAADKLARTDIDSVSVRDE